MTNLSGREQLEAMGLRPPTPTRNGQITITLPFPPAELSPNARCHWRVKAEAVAMYRKTCTYMTKMVMWEQSAIGKFPLKPPVEASITFVLKGKRRRDMDNLFASFKAGIDGIVDAGLLPDDDVRSWSPTLRYEQGEKPLIRIDFEVSP